MSSDYLPVFRALVVLDIVIVLGVGCCGRRAQSWARREMLAPKSEHDTTASERQAHRKIHENHDHDILSLAKTNITAKHQLPLGVLVVSVSLLHWPIRLIVPRSRGFCASNISIQLHRTNTVGRRRYRRTSFFFREAGISFFLFTVWWACVFFAMKPSP